MSNVMKQKPPRRAVEKPVECHECKKTFLTPSLLDKHMHLVHNVPYNVKRSQATGPIGDTMMYDKQLRLGDTRRGITVADGNWTFRIPYKFRVEREEKTGEVILVSKKGTTFKLSSDGEHVFILLFDQWFIFSPFLKIDWLKSMLGVKH